MTEARIECTCPEYRLPDLGLVMRQGDVEWVSEARAKASSTLTHAERIGAVEVRWEKRCTVSKDQIPPWLRRRGKAAPVKRPQRVEPVAAPALLTADEVAQIAREAAREAAGEQVASEVRKVLANVPTLTQADVEAALRNVLGNMPPASLPTAPIRVTHLEGGVEPDEVPVFIPSDLGQVDAVAEIEVQATESKSDGFDQAAEALRAAKPKRKPRRKVKKDA